MQLINLTPHDVVVVADDGSEQTLTYPRSGLVARAVERKTSGTPLAEGMSVGTMVVRYQGVENLPDPVSGVGYIVSVLTVLVAKSVGRTVKDLYYPGSLVRDLSGNVIGCQVLYQLGE